MKKSLILIYAILSLLFTSCATKIRYNVTRPAELDLNGARTISVLPIKSYASINIRADVSNVDFILRTFFTIIDPVSIDEKKTIDYLQSNIERGLVNSPYIDVVSSSSVQQALQKGYLNPADVYLTGEITYFHVNDYVRKEKIQVEKKEGDKKSEYKFIEYYYRNVSMNYKYQIIDSATNKVLSNEVISIDKTSGKCEHNRNLPVPFSMIEYELSETVDKILKELQPYVVTKTIKLLEDKTKNPEMKNADQLAKDGNVSGSYKAFAKIYKETKLFEAGYNAAILQLALGNLSDAEELMTSLYEKTLDSRASKALTDIKYEINQAKRFKSQTEETQDYLE